MFKFLTKIFNSNESEINSLFPTVNQINSLEPALEALSDAELKSKTADFRLKIEHGEPLDSILPEAFGVVREAAKRSLGLRHFDVQLIGGIVLHQGKIAEMKTGEGKTLVSTLPLYLNALNGQGVHLVTVNDYLARRDAEWMGPIFHYLGLNIGVLNHEKSYLYDPNPSTTKIESKDVRLSEEESSAPEDTGLGAGKFLREVTRGEAYSADITYGTNNEFGFDYLRDNMVWDIGQMVQTNPTGEFGVHKYAIVDEVDSILIDEARTPLIISAPAEESTEKYYQFAKIIPNLQHSSDYVVDEKLKTANLTELGVRRVEKMIGVDNLYEKDFETLHHIEQALKAETLFKKDRDYVTTNGEVTIVDEFTGRLMPGRRYSEGLHQAIEAKEGVPIQKESRTLATVSFQNYFRLYNKLAGMTGTAATEAEEFHKIYSLDVVTVPTHRHLIRKDLADQVYKTERAKYEAVVKDIIEKYEKGQPVLVGTTSIERNELISDLLKRKSIPHQLLNAKHHESEAHIIAKAGEPGTITVATNMAGRGVDIKLPPKSQELGGLHVIGTERHESRRIDNQLRGRSGRQGDAGSTRFYVSLHDDIMRLFGGDQVAKVMTMLNLPEDVPIEHTMVSKAIENAQTKVEGHNFDIRKHLVDYDDVMNKQREIIYQFRREILESIKDSDQHLKEKILARVNHEIANLTQTHLTDVVTQEGVESLVNEFITIILFDPESCENLKKELLKTSSPEGVTDLLQKVALDVYNTKENSLGNAMMRQVEKLVTLDTIDTLWMKHLDDIDNLREGIGLRVYAQKDPLVDYKAEAYDLFEKLMASIDFEIVHRIYKVQPSVENPLPQPKPILVGSPNTSSVGPNTPGVSSDKKPGRNDPCPCGSGQKYKKCHGK